MIAPIANLKNFRRTGLQEPVRRKEFDHKGGTTYQIGEKLTQIVA